MLYIKAVNADYVLFSDKGIIYYIRLNKSKVITSLRNYKNDILKKYFKKWCFTGKCTENSGTSLEGALCKYLYQIIDSNWYSSGTWIPITHSAQLEEQFISEYKKLIKEISTEHSLDAVNTYVNLKDNKSYTVIGSNGKYTISKSKVSSMRMNDISHSNQTQVPLNLVIYGPPGTGKTYHTVNKALDIVEPNWKNNIGATEKDEKRKDALEKFNKYVEDERIVFTTFHQALGYEDFIEGIKPDLDNSSDLLYKKEPGIFKKTCEKAQFFSEESYRRFLEDIDTRIKKEHSVFYNSRTNIPQEIKSVDLENLSISFETEDTNRVIFKNIKKLYNYVQENDLTPSDLNEKKMLEALPGVRISRYWAIFNEYYTNWNKAPFVLIIDEINRGNVANIFGELITLIEEDKRLGNKEAMTVTLPCSKEKFGVPNNLYIIGTMNTADRSVEALDSALRRRFVFEEMMPNASLLNENVDGVNLQNFLETINKRIEVLKDREHQIGHSYLMNVTDKKKLIDVIYKNIIPLLQEYFYGDYEKIQMVLGEGFVKKESGQTTFAVEGTHNYSDNDELFHIVSRNSVDIEQALKGINFGYSSEAK